MLRFFREVKFPIYISERTGGPGVEAPPKKKWKVRGAKPPGKFLILRIKNKRFSLKSFNFSVQNSGFFMVRNLLVCYLVGTW